MDGNACDIHFGILITVSCRHHANHMHITPISYCHITFISHHIHITPSLVCVTYIKFISQHRYMYHFQITSHSNHKLSNTSHLRHNHIAKLHCDISHYLDITSRLNHNIASISRASRPYCNTSHPYHNVM